MEIILIIGLGISILFQLTNLFYSYKNYKHIFVFKEEYRNDNPQREIKKIDNNEIMSFIVEYALNSGLECLVMPDTQETSALFARNRITNGIMPVCRIVQTSFNKDSSEYNDFLEKIKNEIDIFIKNNPDFLKEAKNDKN
jgi:hypothetical protein